MSRFQFASFLLVTVAACGDSTMTDSGVDAPTSDAGMRDEGIDSPPSEDLGVDQGDLGFDAGPVCGDGNRDPGEDCDDGNVFPGDGCSPTCTVEPVCGNGTLETGEGCDDGDRDPGDGCSATCTVEMNCGNGDLDPGEDCDDGNTTDGDGCSATCTREPRCGDGTLDPGEACDDGGTDPMDGCDASCEIEVATCGDGTRQAWAEECDDGNTADGDGCSATCFVEGTCAHPIDLAAAGTPTTTGYRYTGSNVGAADNGSGTCRSTLGGLDRVLVYTPPRSGRMTVTTANAGTTYDTVLHARTTCGSLPTQLGCDDDTGGTGRSTFAVDVVGGTPVYLFVDAKVTVSGTMTTSASGAFDLSVDLVSIAADGEACDPAGVTILCAAGLLCAPDGLGGNTCQAGADLGCGIGIPIVELGSRLSHGAVSYSGDTSRSTNNTRGTCNSTTSTAPETVHHLVMPYDARVGINLTSGFDAATYVRSTCTDTATQRVCSDPNVIAPAAMGLLTAGTDLFIYVDGWSTGMGTYTLAVTLYRTLADGDPCDPATPSDTCVAGSLCAPDGAGGHTCQAGIDLGCGVGVPVVDLNPLLTPSGVITYAGDTTITTNHTRGSCSSTTNTAPEIPHQLVLPYDADVRIDAASTWDDVIYVRNMCTVTTSERFCSDPTSVPYTRMGLLPAGTMFYIFVDGWSSGSGAYPLVVHLRQHSGDGGPCGTGTDDPVCNTGLACRLEGTARVCRPSFCGDGVVEGSETCDDGNTTALDGCSATCAIEDAGMGGESCGEAVRLNLVGTATAGVSVARATGTTVTATADLTGSCGMTAPAPDTVYVFGLASRSDVTVTLTPGTGFDAALYIRGGLMRACDDPTGEAYCRDGGGPGTAEPITLHGVPPGTYYIVVDGNGGTTSGRGTYTVDVRATLAP